jgi:predicted nucleic acid-binding protein
LDSSILVKLVITEPGSEKARSRLRKALEGGYSLHTVDIALSEGLNALWKHAKLYKAFEEEEALSAARDLAEIYDGLNILTTRELLEDAMESALTWKITVYDSLYVAAARKLKAILYTADQKLYYASKNIVASELLTH